MRLPFFFCRSLASVMRLRRSADPRGLGIELRANTDERMSGPGLGPGESYGVSARGC